MGSGCLLMACSHVAHDCELEDEIILATVRSMASEIDASLEIRTIEDKPQPRITVSKADREHQSHAVVLRLRKLLEPFNSSDARIKVVEVPPGPPVLSTLVVEVHADDLVTYEQQRQAGPNEAEFIGTHKSQNWQ